MSLKRDKKHYLSSNTLFMQQVALVCLCHVFKVCFSIVVENYTCITEGFHLRCLCCAVGCCYLKCNEVLKLLLDVLCDNSNCGMFGSELTNVILKDVLSIRTSWYSLSASVCLGKLFWCLLVVCSQLCCSSQSSEMANVKMNAKL